MLRFTTTGFIAETGAIASYNRTASNTQKHLFSVPSANVHGGSDLQPHKQDMVCPPCCSQSIQRSLDSSLSVVGCRFIRSVVLNQLSIPPPAVEHQSAVGFPFIQVNLAFSNLSLSDRLLVC